MNKSSPSENKSLLVKNKKKNLRSDSMKWLVLPKNWENKTPPCGKELQNMNKKKWGVGIAQSQLCPAVMILFKKKKETCWENFVSREEETTETV